MLSKDIVTNGLCAGNGDYALWDCELASQKKPEELRRSKYVDRCIRFFMDVGLGHLIGEEVAREPSKGAQSRHHETDPDFLCPECYHHHAGDSHLD